MSNKFIKAGTNVPTLNYVVMGPTNYVMGKPNKGTNRKFCHLAFMNILSNHKKLFYSIYTKKSVKNFIYP